VEIEVFGKYVDPKKFRILPASFLRPENVNAVTQQLAELGQQAAAAGPNQVLIANAIAIILTDLRQKKAPEAYMGYALYDADSNLYESGKILLSKKARNKHEELNRKLYISKDGYMEAFLVNETSENVWFDQFRIETTTPVILQETHYDPWGVELQGLGYQEPGSKVNKYLYNGKEFNDHLGLNLFDYGARMYDASVGRWFTVDPLAELPSQIAHSPYVYAWNNPVGMIDPTGMAAEESDPGKKGKKGTEDPPPGWEEMGILYGGPTISGERIYPNLGEINKSNQNAQAGWGWVDAAQMGLDAIGMTEIPVVSQGAELVSAGISFGRGDTYGGLIGLGSMIPIAGKYFEALKVGRYGNRFYDAYRSLEKFKGTGLLEIHHRIPQKYIRDGLFPEEMMTSLSNLQGLPTNIHQKIVTPAWNAFMRNNPNPSRTQVMKFAIEMDKVIAPYINRIGR
jgi:RHS repeat-associated protein